MTVLDRWVWTNGWQLFAKISALFAKAAPGPAAKKLVLNAAGTSAGVAAYLVQFGRRTKTRNYLSAVYGRENGAVTVFGCFTQAGRDFVWDIVSFDSPALVAGLIDISDWLPIKRVLDEKRGAVMIGAHYGPSFNIQTFTHAGSLLNATVLLSEAAAESKRNKTKRAVKFLRAKPDKTDPAPERLALAGRQERTLVEKIRQGGSIYVNNDMPREDGGVLVGVLDWEVRLSAFSFKLAIKYKTPVYFCACKTDGVGGYTWLATEAPTFSTAEEGGLAYAEWLNGLIKENPALWHGLRFYK